MSKLEIKDVGEAVRYTLIKNDGEEITRVVYPDDPMEVAAFFEEIATYLGIEVLVGEVY